MDFSHTGGEYSLLFAANPMPMWVFDIETLQFLEVNEAAIAKYGFGRDEFLGMTIADIRPPEDVPGMNAHLKAPAAESHRYGVWRHHRKDGTPLTVEITAQDVVFKQRPDEVRQRLLRVEIEEMLSLAEFVFELASVISCTWPRWILLGRKSSALSRM